MMFKIDHDNVIKIEDVFFLFLKNVVKLWFKFYYESYFYLPNIEVYQR
jgi:hypothetical protein